MKNTDFFPFSRNRYFAGKHLVTRDMEAEQLYFNNKRRLINCQLYGGGVVCGLGVTPVKQKSASDAEDGVSVVVEPGLALDAMGREIAVPGQVYLRLSNLEGFTTDKSLAGYVYLCLEYNEIECEPMPGILDAVPGAGNHNRAEDSYRFYLTYAEPNPSPKKSDSGDVKKLIRGYCDTDLEKRLEQAETEKLYLARIHMVHWEEAYEITDVDSIPFEQYIINAPLTADILEMLYELIPSPGGGAPEPDTPVRPDPPEPRISQGTLSIDIPGNLKPGALVFSKDTLHGLGIGQVFVTAGLAADGGVVCGARGIFDDTDDYEYAVKTDEDAGSFKIGVRILQPQIVARLEFSWLAVRDMEGAGEKPLKPYLVIFPGSVRLPLRGTAQFSCEAYSTDADAIVWSVREATGGTIDPDGFYRAPNTAGVYEITARNASNPLICSSAFVVVYEP